MPAVKTRMVPALRNALQILEFLTNSRAGLTLPEIVAHSNLAKSSAHYLLVTLERCGYVCRCTRTGRYMLGDKLFAMANAAPSSLSLRIRTAPYLSGLTLRTGLTVHLAILDRTEAVLIGKHETTHGPRLATWIGKRMDLHCTAVGKALLAFLPKEQITAIIRKHGLGRHNENTIGSPQRLFDELATIVRNGYALNDEEDELGVRCLGMPIFDPERRPIASISLAGTVPEIDLNDLQRLSNELRCTATSISREINDSRVSTTSLQQTLHSSIA